MNLPAFVHMFSGLNWKFHCVCLKKLAFYSVSDYLFAIMEDGEQEQEQELLFVCVWVKVEVPLKVQGRVQIQEQIKAKLREQVKDQVQV